jgi:hypothetical protein
VLLHGQILREARVRGRGIRERVSTNRESELNVPDDFRGPEWPDGFSIDSETPFLRTRIIFQESGTFNAKLKMMECKRKKTILLDR